MQYDEQDVEKLFGSISQKEDNSNDTMSDERKAALWKSVNEKLMIATTVTAVSGWTIFKTSLLNGRHALFYKILIPIVFTGGVGIGCYAYLSDTEMSNPTKTTNTQKQPAHNKPLENAAVHTTDSSRHTDTPSEIVYRKKPQQATRSINNTSSPTPSDINDSIASQMKPKEATTATAQDSLQSAPNKPVVMYRRIKKQVVMKQSAVLLPDSTDSKQ